MTGIISDLVLFSRNTGLSQTIWVTPKGEVVSLDPDLAVDQWAETYAKSLQDYASGKLDAIEFAKAVT